MNLPPVGMKVWIWPKYTPDPVEAEFVRRSGSWTYWRMCKDDSSFRTNGCPLWHTVRSECYWKVLIGVVGGLRLNVESPSIFPLTHEGVSWMVTIAHEYRKAVKEEAAR